MLIAIIVGCCPFTGFADHAHGYSGLLDARDEAADNAERLTRTGKIKETIKPKDPAAGLHALLAAWTGASNRNVNRLERSTTVIMDKNSMGNQIHQDNLGREYIQQTPFSPREYRN